MATHDDRPPPVADDAPAPTLTAEQAEQLVLRVIGRHSAALLRTARLHSLCADDAQEAYQRGMEILLRRAATLDPKRASSWLHTDDALRSEIDRSCDYTFVVPCSAEPGATHTIDWPSLNLADGPHRVSAVVTDASGNGTESPAQTVLVDTHAPGPPIGVAYASGTRVTWSDPSQGGGAPIADTSFVLCRTATSSCTNGDLPGAVTSADFPLQPGSDYTLALRLTDAAGHTDPANTATLSIHAVAADSGPPAHLASAALHVTHVARDHARYAVHWSIASHTTGTLRARLTRSARGRTITVAQRSVAVAAHTAGLSVHCASVLRTNVLSLTLTYAGDSAHAAATAVRSLPIAAALRRECRVP